MTTTAKPNRPEAHTDNAPMSIKDTALSLIPGYTQRARIFATLGITAVHDGIPVVRPAYNRTRAVATVEAEVERLLLAGDEIPDDIGAHILLAEKIDAELNARAKAIDSVVRRHAGTDELFNERAIGDALDYLRDQLAQVIESAKQRAATVGNATSAADAIGAGSAAINAWRELTTLADEYNEIRSVQRDLQRAQHNALVTFTDARFDATAMFADALDVHPHWVERRRSSGLVSSANEPQTIAYREWLGSARQSPAFEKDLEPAYRLMLIATTTTPWVPSPSAYEEAYRLANHASSQAKPDVVTSMEQARLAYYTVTGAAHNHTVSAEAGRSNKGGLRAYLRDKDK
jgi:hypothetical protein